MNAAEPARRFRLAMIITVMAIMALGSFWVLEIMRRDAGDFLPGKERTEPDFYVDNFSYVRLSKTGEARYHISGIRLTHNPRDDSYDIEQPLLSNQSKSVAAPTTVRAERAHVEGDYSKVHLYDNVRLDRPASATTEELHVRSEYIMVLPDEDVAQTDKPVEITLGRSTLTGVGMWANNATRELRVASNVHGTYQPPTR